MHNFKMEGWSEEWPEMDTARETIKLGHPSQLMVEIANKLNDKLDYLGTFAAVGADYKSDAKVTPNGNDLLMITFDAFEYSKNDTEAAIRDELGKQYQLIPVNYNKAGEDDGYGDKTIYDQATYHIAAVNTVNA